MFKASAVAALPVTKSRLSKWCLWTARTARVLVLLPACSEGKSVGTE
jgi:hypothetical protein